jgi:hypothetical protein
MHRSWNLSLHNGRRDEETSHESIPKYGMLDRRPGCSTKLRQMTSHSIRGKSTWDIIYQIINHLRKNIVLVSIELLVLLLQQGLLDDERHAADILHQQAASNHLN